jgi:peptidoglycan/xylan/chitin deacetylase (PgdA/CDA1 family)
MPNMIWQRLQSRYQRTLSAALFRRPFRLQNRVPLISFTFDDFPRSAVHSGARILKEFGARGTFYASFGLMGKRAPTGDIFLREDLETLLADGHEVGCHTFAHCDSWTSPARVFEDSVIENASAFRKYNSNGRFRTLSYPLSCPRPRTKRRVERHFRACRGGGQTYNLGVTDLNLLKAFFLEKSRTNPERIEALIRENSAARGWLIFATHDVGPEPTPYGCTPSFFETVVRWSRESGADILPVSDALELAASETA